MKKALIIVDIQKDFCEGGSLAVPGGNAIVSRVNKLKNQFISEGNIVIASRELHPNNHLAFASTNNKPPFTIDENGNVLWPDHCVTNTEGSEFNDKLDLSGVTIFTKGKDLTDHPLSAFSAISDVKDVWLNDFLESNGVDEVVVVGLALEYCVCETALDSEFYGFETSVIINSTGWLSESGKNDTLVRFKENHIKVL